MKILFLDFDGVLNCTAYVRRHEGSGVVIAPEKMPLIKRIVEKTGAKIVLSTSWREHWSPEGAQCDEIGHEINAIFRRWGLEIFCKIPQNVRSREENMRLWLQQHPDVTHFAVLDDALLGAAFLREHFVHTADYLGGLQEEDTQKAISILMREE